MKKQGIIVSLLLCAVCAFSQSRQASYDAYIEQYAPIAQQQMKEHGIPASITLAQGLLESGAGKSELARNANNHFGIKCTSDWKGEGYSHDDNKKGECFRKYDNPAESFEDHSKFLLRDRYASLFELKPTDYKGWANGLRRCGYATDPQYGPKLIKIIEDYDLAQYDKAGGKTVVRRPANNANNNKKIVKNNGNNKNKKSTKRSTHRHGRHR